MLVIFLCKKVSNWGGNALGAAMTLLASECIDSPEDKVALWNMCMPTDDEDQSILDAMVISPLCALLRISHITLLSHLSLSLNI